MELAVPDLVSNSYFPVLAAAKLGYFQREWLEHFTEAFIYVVAGEQYPSSAVFVARMSLSIRRLLKVPFAVAIA